MILREAPELPEGWCGKQHACHTLGALASKPWIVFVDADVRLSPDALARMAAFMEETGADLGSGFPRQETVGLLEQLLIPLIHFILLGYLPIRQMRINPEPSLSAGCGQLFIARKSAYEAREGTPSSRPRSTTASSSLGPFEPPASKTDLFDATDLASCRMYRNFQRGLARARQKRRRSARRAGDDRPGVAPAFGGQVLPDLLLLLAWPLKLSWVQIGMAATASLATYMPRYLGIKRFHQPVLGAILHSAGIMLLLAIQWYAFFRDILGRPAVWKGRPYPAKARTAG